MPSESTVFLPAPPRCLPILKQHRLKISEDKEIKQKRSEMQFIRDWNAREIKVGIHDPHRKTKFDKHSRVLVRKVIA